MNQREHIDNLQKLNDVIYVRFTFLDCQMLVNIKLAVITLCNGNATLISKEMQMLIASFSFLFLCTYFL